MPPIEPSRLGRTRRRSRLTVLGAATAAAVALTAGLLANARQSPADSPDVLLGHGADHLPSSTASDWVTYADHVVAVTAAEESEIAPTAVELERGEGTIGRTVTLTVDKVLWSRPDAPRPAPDVWEYSATGWQFLDGDTGNRTKMALVDQPRVETGHRYVMAITWEEARCSPGDVPEPAQWRGLGEGSEVPFDNGILGRGELEGHVRSAARHRSAAHAADEGATLEHQLAGRGEGALVEALNAATPRTPEVSGFVPRSEGCA
ncbi:hypothetical protein GCM10010400_64470 [Streptomyces aculeolatus]|uniref:hypothetical protein n=1 Tax=Streptomyces aculeolatus TaxID=270689 RepID=UPI0003A95412|nr:hypothetical protein [Streptomyces aculeolatus]